MNKKLMSMITVGSALTILASLVPAATYADTTGTGDINVKVKPSLTLDVSPKTVNMTADANRLAEGEIIAKVTSNSPYTISMSATEPNLVVTESGRTDNIPAIADGGTSALPAGTSAWGIKKVNDTAPESLYTGITTGLVEFYRSTATFADAKTTIFPVGIMVASGLPSGTYQTVVTVTATNTNS